MGGSGVRRQSLHAALAAAVAALLVFAQAALADHPQAAPDINQMDYAYADGGNAPAGSYQWGEPIPGPGDAGSINPNPSGKYLAYDMNVFESLTFPGRQPGDETNNDPPGNGGMPYGFCPPDPLFVPQGKCDNHQLEYLDHYEKTMKELLGDFGVVVKRYQFDSPGSRQVPGTGTVGGLQAAPGRAFNISATIPGADHPDEEILVSGHYDFTDGGPAAAWDSSEGHTMVIRIAKILSDYWRKTGTRPSATIKFIPWDSEESGTFGSQDYVENNVPPGNEHKIRGYFNMDPCAGGYPAFYHGNPDALRIQEVLQLSDPAAEETEQQQARTTAFNARAEKIVDEVFDHLDDKLITQPGTPEIFVSNAEAEAMGIPSQRGEIVTALGGLLLFGSDYANFDGIGVPIFNLFPDVFGPHADGTPASPEGVSILHTPRDNLTTLNALTSTDQSGLTASEGWAKGQEMCSHIEGWYMLQPEMGGAQTRNVDPVAYYEALPNEAIQKQNVNFDASGSYQYADAGARSYVDESQLEFSWDFGDGSNGTGKTVQHAYADVGRYTSTLTVRNKATGQTDTMTLPIEVIGSDFDPPVLEAPAPKDEDGNFPLKWEFEGQRDGFAHFSVEEATDYVRPLFDDAEGDLNARWEASETTNPQHHPWQKSNGSPAVAGNIHNSGESGYWTGTFPTAPAPTDQSSTLTLKETLSIPDKGEPILAYHSFFQNESDDEGRVEAALEDGNPDTPLQWQTVDQVTGLFSPTDPSFGSMEMQARQVSLARFRGKQIRMRFNYILGPNDPAASQPVGWYIDDIKVENGTWRSIGTSATTAFEVFGKRKGTYGYRVKGVYNDGIETQASNAEVVEVTGGAAVAGAVANCSSTLGFRGASAKPENGGRALRFTYTRRVDRPVTVSLIRQTSGRRILPNRAVRRFRNPERSFAFRGRGVPAGYYVARFRMDLGKRIAIRETAVRRSRGRWRALRPFHRPASCSTLRSFKLGRPVFGGSRSRPLKIDFRLARKARVAITVKRGKKIVRTYKASDRLGRITYHLTLAAEFLRRGNYRAEIRLAGSKTRSSLFARRL